MAFHSWCSHCTLRHGRWIRIHKHLFRRQWGRPEIQIMGQEELWSQWHCQCKLRYDDDSTCLYKNWEEVRYTYFLGLSRYVAAWLSDISSLLLRVWRPVWLDRNSGHSFYRSPGIPINPHLDRVAQPNHNPLLRLRSPMWRQTHLCKIPRPITHRHLLISIRDSSSWTWLDLPNHGLQLLLSQFT